MSDEEKNTTARAVSRCGAYELIREINRGGTGSVWEGRHITLGRRVAVKVLHAEFTENPELVARLEREGQAAARINHPHVAQMLDVGHDDHRMWLVMEYLEGEDLESFLQREGVIEPARAVDLLLPVLSAIASAHKAGVVHRDLKPGNIFLTRDADGSVSPKVVDFGFSKIRVEGRADDNLTRPETSLGTLSYMPMEQLHAASEAPPAVDQYALAVTLYRCVTGRLPFPGSSRYDTFRALTAGVFPRPVEVVPSLSAALDAVIVKAMGRTPDQRYASVRDFAVALLPFASPVAQSRWSKSFSVTAPHPRVVTPAPTRVKTPAQPRVATPLPTQARVTTPAPRRATMPPPARSTSVPPRPARSPSAPPEAPPEAPRRPAPAPQQHGLHRAEVALVAAVAVVAIVAVLTVFTLR